MSVHVKRVLQTGKKNLSLRFHILNSKGISEVVLRSFHRGIPCQCQLGICCNWEDVEGCDKTHSWIGIIRRLGISTLRVSTGMEISLAN